VFILPSPLSFTPQRSRPPVNFFGAPHRLPARTRIKYLLANCETSARWKHPCDHHVGVPSCGQQAATTSVTHICFIRYPIAQALFQGPRRNLHLVSGPPKIVFSPPTRSYLFSTPLAHLITHVYIHLAYTSIR
jgi:hypothetical protein